MSEPLQNKFVLRHGCHRGTLTSRDVAEPSQHDTYQAAYDAYIVHRKFYTGIGYKIWYAEITAPDGGKTMLESNHYR